VELEITPEPSPDERKTILAALTALLEGESNAPGAWWEAGVRESVEAGDGAEPDF
jgi:hypothetical protein